MKTCSRCTRVKPEEEFSKDSSAKDGLCYWCKACYREHRRSYYLKNQETVKAKSKKWREENPGKGAEYHREWVKNNPERTRKIKQKWKDQNKDKSRDYQLKNQYGITLDDYCEMKEGQGHTCLICGTSEDDERVKRSLVVDHCHTSGEVRGLLCAPCNSGLGFFKDNIEWLERAISYLKKEIK